LVGAELSLSGDNQHVAVQWCLIGDALRQCNQSAPGSGSRANGPVTFYHNLWKPTANALAHHGRAVLGSSQSEVGALAGTKVRARAADIDQQECLMPENRCTN